MGDAKDNTATHLEEHDLEKAATAFVAELQDGSYGAVLLYELMKNGDPDFDADIGEGFRLFTQVKAAKLAFEEWRKRMVAKNSSLKNVSEERFERFFAEASGDRGAEDPSWARAMPKKQINFRATPETRVLLDRMVDVLGMPQTDVVGQAIAEMAERVLPKGGKK